MSKLTRRYLAGSAVGAALVVLSVVIGASGYADLSVGVSALAMLILLVNGNRCLSAHYRDGEQ